MVHFCRADVAESGDPVRYHSWYETRRGRWIGDIEFDLINRLICPRPGDTLLDVGCGTGYFGHRFALRGIGVTSVDPNLRWLAFAAARASDNERLVCGRAESLPFNDRSLDHAISVTALCFMTDPRPGLAEILRVTRRRFAIGLLNRQSLLYRDKGRGGGSGAYRGARWHTPAEVLRLFDGLPAVALAVRTAVFDAGGGVIARNAETLLPNRLPWGALVVAAGEVRRS